MAFRNDALAGQLISNGIYQKTTIMFLIRF